MFWHWGTEDGTQDNILVWMNNAWEILSAKLFTDQSGLRWHTAKTAFPGWGRAQRTSSKPFLCNSQLSVPLDEGPHMLQSLCVTAASCEDWWNRTGIIIRKTGNVIWIKPWCKLSLLVIKMRRLRWRGAPSHWVSAAPGPASLSFGDDFWFCRFSAECSLPDGCSGTFRQNIADPSAPD